MAASWEAIAHGSHVKRMMAHPPSSSFWARAAVPGAGFGDGNCRVVLVARYRTRRGHSLTVAHPKLSIDLRDLARQSQRLDRREDRLPLRTTHDCSRWKALLTTMA